jgi:hypothetical protein
MARLDHARLHKELKRTKRPDTSTPTSVSGPKSDVGFVNLTRRAKHPPCAKTRQASPAKIFHFTEIRNCVIHPPSRSDGEGRSYVATNADWGAVDAAAPGTRRRDQGEMNLVRSLCVRNGRRRCPAKPLGEAGSLRTAKPCGPGRHRYGQALRRWIEAQPGREASPIRKVTEARRNSAPGRARHRPSDHRAGKAGCFPAHLFSACAFACANFSRSGSRVPAGTRPSLRPLHGRG